MGAVGVGTLRRGKGIDHPTRVEIALDNVEVGQIGLVMDGDPRAAVLAEPFVSLVGHMHVVLRENTGIKVKMRRVKGDELGKEHPFDLPLDVLERVSVHEASSFRGVGVEVKVVLEPLFFVQREHVPLGSQHGRVFRRVRGIIVPVQVVPVAVGPVVSHRHSVWVHHWNDVEGEAISEQSRTRVVLVQKEVEHPVEKPLRGDLA